MSTFIYAASARRLTERGHVAFNEIKVEVVDPSRTMRINVRQLEFSVSEQIFLSSGSCHV